MKLKIVFLVAAIGFSALTASYASDLYPSEVSLDFSAKPGECDYQEFALKNYSSDEIVITEINPVNYGGSMDFSVSDDCVGTLGPNESCVVEVSYCPDANEVSTAEVSIRHSEGEEYISLSGSLSP